MIDSRFDDIRQYHDDEIPDAMKRIADSSYFHILSDFVFPEQPVAEIQELVRNITTTHEFQDKVMKKFNEQVIKRSIDKFTVNGLEYLDPHKSYLFVSNHRDIVLDSSLFQYAIFTHGFDTTDITFGANLMKGQLVIDIGKSNKMFKVERPSSSREFIYQSRHLSDFIREDIVTQHHSVWIAQRNGRTKNGIDATDPGIIKMFCMSSENDIKGIKELNIVPISVSYEWEPCDILKAIELTRSMNGRYVKAEGEDLNSILYGILQPKGCTHFEICKPLDIENEPTIEGRTNNAFYKEVAHILDYYINSAFKLMHNHYIAHDLRKGTTTHRGEKYTMEQYEYFLNRMETLLATTPEGVDCNIVKEKFLDIYANSVDNHIFE